MSIFTYHLVQIPFSLAIKKLFVSLINKNTQGLIYSECMSLMTLGSPILSTSRFLIREIAIFAQWENEKALNDFLNNDNFGKILSKGWYLKLAYMRKWGKIKGFQIPKEKARLDNENSPVVAVTIARMKPLEIPRFLHWGRPVEKLVRDNKNTLLSLASIKFPNIVSTFSIWKNVQEMENMVHGHSKMSEPKRHSNAMKERNRKSFHFEFITLRFKPLTEFGIWKKKSNYLKINNEWL